MTTAYKQLFVCMMLLASVTLLHAQTDSMNMRLHTDTIVYDTIRPSDADAKALQSVTTYGAGWYLMSQALRFFNIGVYYSYMMPAGSLKKDVPAVSAFSFDVGLDLTHLVGRNDLDWHWLVGINGDYSNFGKSKSPTGTVSGDTTHTYSVSSSVALTSFYVETEYARYFIAPYASVAYTTAGFSPYKRTTRTIHNANMNSKTTVGEELEDFRSRGVNITAGLKCKYRFNDHRQLMILSRVSYVLTSPVDMIDLTTATFSPNGDIAYQTKKVNPSWFVWSIGMKYNF